MALTQVDQGLLGQYAQYTGFKNRIINGAMMIDQRNNGALVAGATGNIYGVDRTAVGVFGSGTGRISAQQTPSATESGYAVRVSAGFNNYLAATVTTADASPSAAYGYCVCQRIEGYNVADFGFGAAGASTVTVSFWVRASITGSYVLTLQNENADRSYTTLYTINAANTWEYKTVTIAGDTTGTWFKTNAAGLIVYWGLGGGSSRLAPSLNAWSSGVAGNYAVTVSSGSVNWIATNGATFYITGVQLEKGSTATSFDYRPYGTELQLCQRYCQAYRAAQAYDIVGSLIGLGYGTTAGGGPFQFKQEMRAAPTMTRGGNWRVLNYASGFAISGWAFDSLRTTTFACEWNFTGATGLTAGATYYLQANNDATAYFILSAEL